MIFQAKRETQAYLEDLASKGKITYTFIFTGLFFTLDLPYPFAGIDYKNRKGSVIGTGNELFSLTHLDDIGAFTAAVLKKPEETKNKVIRIAAENTTANDIIAKFESQTGEKFDITYRPAEKVEAEIAEALKSQNYGVYFANAIGLFTGTGVHSTLWEDLISSAFNLINLLPYNILLSFWILTL